MMNGGKQSTANRKQVTANDSRLTAYGQRLLAPLAILALSLVAIYPLFKGSLPCSDDAAFHLLRLTQLDHLLRQGVVYSRWAPDMAQGYGFPFFNFYAPLSYYLAEAVSFLAQNLNLGMRLTLALGVYATGLAAYLLARDHFSRPAALVTAVATIYAPYYAFDIYFRGNLAESMAWPLFPLALWAMGRLVRTRQTRWLLTTTFAYAAILLTHNVFALIFSPLLALYGLWEIVNCQRSTANGQQVSINHWLLTIGHALLPLFLGLGLAAFFWLPAFLERSLVHSDRLLVPPIFVYWGNFVTLGEIFAAPQTVRPDLLNPSPARALGLVPLLLALPALLFGWRRFRDGRRRQIAFFGLATAVYVFLMTAVSRPIWDNLPLIEFVQFPWRLLGPAALTLAVLVGASVDVLASQVSRRLIFAALFITALVLADLTWLDARFCPGLANPTIAEMQEFERQSATIGTTAKGEYLPRTVEYMPDQPAVEPFAPLPDTAVLQSASRAPLHFQAAISATEPFTLTANVFDYAGWRAEVDGRAVPITPTTGTGLISLPIPAGSHTVDIRFGGTPLRVAAALISLASLAVLLLWAVQRPSPQAPSPAGSRSPFPAACLWFVGLGLFLFFFVHFLLPRLETPLRRAALPGMAETAVFTNNLILRDYQIAGRTLPADAALAITAYWQAGAGVDRAYRDTVRLIGPDGNLWSEKTASAPRAFRAAGDTQTWPADRYAESQHLLTPLPGTPPGVYHIELILFDVATLATAPLTNGRLTLDLGTVQITPPRAAGQPPTQFVADTAWDGVRLTGYSLDRAEAAPGDPFLLTLVWRAETDPTAHYTARLSLLAADGRVPFQLDLPPVRADFPTGQWAAGDWWRGQHGFRLPVDLDSGAYRWQLALCDGACDGRETTADLGVLTIHAPERIVTPPPLDVILNAPFGDLALLLGANVAVADGRLQTTLAWRAAAETPTSYRVFVHLVDEAGQILAQSDGEPAAWTRPTTGWLPGEIILDDHVLAVGGVPAGTYRLHVGLYDPAGGGRVPLPDGATAVTIPDIVLP
ncbi:MAG: YfhO family protein [Chloroflexi bacterium]|nr:YfhO family protein [Chloroflexota bacterium]